MFRIIPKQKIGGLEISQNSLTFAYLLDEKRKKFFKLKIACPQCFINGEIQNEKEIKEVLKKLNSHIKEKLKFKKKELVKVALTLPGTNFFSQPFNLPIIGKEELKEAILLNLKLNAPQDFEKLCSDWQIQRVDFPSNKITFLGVFFPKESIEKLELILRETGFLPVAIESFSLSLCRAINFFLPLKFSDLNLFYLTEEGIEVAIIIERKVHYFFFQEWIKNSFEKKEDLIEFVKTTLFHTKTFWESHFKIKFPEIIFLAGKVNSKVLEAVAKEIKKEFPQTFSLSLLEPSYGAALRKSLGIYQQKEINLLSSGSLRLAEKEFKKTFFSFWQKILFSALVIGIGALFLMRFFLNLTLNSFEKNLKTLQRKNAPQIELSKKLQSEAREFNQMVDYLIQVQNQAFLPVNFFEKIKKISQQNEVKILEIIPLKEKIFRFKGEAPSTKKILHFAETLRKEKEFSNINLSLKDIQQMSEDKFIFQLTFSYQEK